MMKSPLSRGARATPVPSPARIIACPRWRLQSPTICRRIRRQSRKTATVAEFGQSPFSTTAAGDYSLQCGQGFRKSLQIVLKVADSPPVHWQKIKSIIINVYHATYIKVYHAQSLESCRQLCEVNLSWCEQTSIQDRDSGHFGGWRPWQYRQAAERTGLSSSLQRCHFLARDSIMLYSALYATARPSHGWISHKRLKLGSCTFHHRVAR